MSVEPAHLIAFNAALLAAVAAPGPALIHAMRATLAQGRAAGFATGCGLAAMAAGWTLAALWGLAGLLALFPWIYAAARMAGAAYLIWIAWRTWRGAREPVAARAAPRGRAFLGGVLVNLANPKSVLFAGAVLVVIFPPGLSVAETLLVALNHLALEVAFYAMLTALLARPAVSRGYLAAKPALDRLAAAVMGALGLRLLLNRA